VGDWQREKVEAKGPIDLKAWTRDQIYAEALKSYNEIWQHRSELSQTRPPDHSNTISEAGTYPDGIRSTLRDAVSYMSIELLANSGYWSPSETNEVYRLDFPALLAGAPPQAKLDLADGKLHPIQRIAAVLDDLEDWHKQKWPSEAALRGTPRTSAPSR